MSTNERVALTVRGHDPAREAALIDALRAWVKAELRDAWDWREPRVVPARDGAREVQHDSADAVILRDAVAWQDRARAELGRRVVEVNGAPCACEVALCDRGGELATLHPTCDPVVLELLGRVWDEDTDSSLYDAGAGGPAQHATLAAAYAMLPDDARRTAWAHLVATPAAARDPGLAAVMREYLRTPVVRVSTAAWYAHLEALDALDGGRETGAASVEELESISRRVADGAAPSEARDAQRPAASGPRLGLGGVLPTWSCAAAPFMDQKSRRVLYDLTDETVGLRDWLVARGRVAAPADPGMGGIPVELLVEMLTVLLEESVPSTVHEEAIVAMKVEGSTIVVPPADAPGGAPWVRAVRDLCEFEALAERISAEAVRRLAARGP